MCVCFVFQSGTPLPLITEAVRSLVSLSDLLTEPAQFQWMLAACLDLARSPLSEHELLSQYLVIAICKSSAVLKPVTILLIQCCPPLCIYLFYFYF